MRPSRRTRWVPLVFTLSVGKPSVGKGMAPAP